MIINETVFFILSDFLCFLKVELDEKTNNLNYSMRFKVYRESVAADPGRVTTIRTSESQHAVFLFNRLITGFPTYIFTYYPIVSLQLQLCRD